MLVLIGLLVLAGEAGVNTRGRLSRAGGQAAQRPGSPPAAAGAQLVAAAGPWLRSSAPALGVPIGTLVYWMAASHATTLPGASLWAALGHTAAYSAAAALVATALALPVALLAVRFRSPGVGRPGAQHLPGAVPARAW